MDFQSWAIAIITALIAVGIIGFTIKFVRKNKSQTQRVDRGSSANQAGGDINITRK